MRILLPAALLLAACSGGEEAAEQNRTPPAPRPTGAAPRTPVTQGVTPQPGNDAGWMEPASNATDPKQAPFADQGLDRPLVNGSER